MRIVNRGLIEADGNGYGMFCKASPSYDFSNEAGATVAGDMVFVRGLAPDSAYGSNDGTIDGEVYLSSPGDDFFPACGRRRRSAPNSASTIAAPSCRSTCNRRLVQSCYRNVLGERPAHDQRSSGRTEAIRD